MSLQPSTKTFQDLSSEVKRVFGDESGVQLEDADLIRWTNAAQMDIVTQNGALKAKSSTSSVAGQATYTLPGLNIQQIASLHYDNRLLPNTPFAEAERIFMSRDPGMEATGTPELWYEWAGEFTLYPTPTEPKSITVYYTVYPDTITGDPAQLLSLPDRLYNAVVNYVLAKCYEMDEEFQASQLAEQRYRESVQSQFANEREAQDMAYPVVQDVWY